MVTLNLDKIFNPKSVAIIGASNEEGSVGYAIENEEAKQGAKQLPRKVEIGIGVHWGLDEMHSYAMSRA